MRFDVAVIGGGPAGAAAAIAWRSAGASVLLLERTEYEAWRAGESLGPRVREPLELLGVWDRFMALGPAPACAVRVIWGAAEAYERSAVFDAWGHGWSVERRRFDAMLAEAAEERGVVVRRGVPRIEVGGGPGAWEIGGETARWIVDASGRTGRVARTLGARWVAYDRMVGVVARMTGEAEAEPVLMIEAVELGWWYSAPLPDGGLVVALMTDADLWAGDVDAWRERLAGAEHTRARTAGLRVDGPIRVRAAGSGRLVPGCGEGWIAAGDAACAWDPLSGDGVERALRGGVASAQLEDRGMSTVANMRTFERTLEIRNMYYRRETRWERGLFWRRRHAPDPAQEPLTLDPEVRLSRGARDAAAAEGLLAPSEVAALCGLCEGTPASEVVRVFRGGTNYGDDRRAIVALQCLLASGALTRARARG